MKRFLKSKLVLSLAAFLMIVAAVVIPLTGSIARSHAASATTVLSEDFETGAPGWTTTGFWHIQDHPETISVKSPDINPNLVTLPDSGQLPTAFNGTHAAWFGEASTGTFCGSDFNTITQTPKDGCTSTQVHSGELTSPTFSLAGATSAEVQFQAWWEIESVNANTFDLMTVEYTIDGGASWQQAGKLNPVNNPAGKHDQDYTANGIEKPAQWNQDIVDLSGAAGQSSVQIRFKFDTVDDLYQGFRGWLVDNVVVSTPFVSPNPSIASLNPACVSSSASLPVTITGSNFVSGSKVLLDSNDIGGAVLSAQTIEFTANNLAVGNHSVQVVSPNGAKSNTATLISAQSCPTLKHQALFVLLQGLNTSLSDTDVTKNGGLGIIPDFDTTKNNVPGIVPYLKAHNYGSAKFLAYSYSASNSSNGHPFAYKCIDTFENSLEIDAVKLSNQIRNFLNTQPKSTITDIYLIGHSLGGAVAFTYLTALVKHKVVAPLPANANLKGVITLDSPVGGVSGNTTFINIVFEIYKRRLFGLLGCKLLLDKKEMVSVFDLVSVFNTTSKPTFPPTDDGNPGSQGAHASILKAIFGGSALTNQAVTEAAATIGTAVLTIGNTIDYLYDPSACVAGLPTFKNSQWVGDEGPFDATKDHHSPLTVYGRKFTAGGSCIAHLLDINHFQVYNNSDVETGILQFLSGKAPNALVIAPPEP